MREHEPWEISHEWLWLHMEVPEHLITEPLSNQIDDVAVYYWSEDFHGTSGAEGVGITSLALNPRFGLQKPMAFLRVFDIMVRVMFPTSLMEPWRGLVGWGGDPRGISGGSPTRRGPPWGTRYGSQTPCVLYFLPWHRYSGLWMSAWQS